MQTNRISQLIRQQLPILIEQDKELQEVVFRLARDRFASRSEIRMLIDELRQDRETQARKWEEQNRKWDEARAEDGRKWEEQNRKWEEQNRKWEEQNRKWDEARAEDRRKWEEQNRKWDEARAEDRRKWEEQNGKWEEQNRKWEANQQELGRLYHEIRAVAERTERNIGALGARWGISSERAFRNALAAILERSFGVEVLNVTEYDDNGEVFGRPEQIELDVIIKNGLLILCELKSSVSKADLYMFERKVRFYERRHERKANRLLIISPMIVPKAMTIAKQLAIETYTDSEDVPVE
jgi:hypothetical protein